MTTRQGRTKQLTLVTHYGEKPARLAQLISALTSLAHRHAGGDFQPYGLGQVHATLVGLETSLVNGMEVNRGFWTLRQERYVQSLGQVIDLVNTSEHLPLSVRIGGYYAGTSYPFDSRGEHPYLRSFQIQGDRAVVMGWPHVRGVFDESLTRLRKSFEAAHVLHKYHEQPSDRDNDLFLVLGRFRRVLARPRATALEAEARELLASSPVDVQVARTTSSLVAYIDPELPPEHCQRFPVTRDSLPAVLEWMRLGD